MGLVCGLPWPSVRSQVQSVSCRLSATCNASPLRRVSGLLRNTFIIGPASCDALPIARPKIASTPGRHARTERKRARCSATAIFARSAVFIWGFGLRASLSACAPANPHRARRQLEPSNSELSIDYQEVAGAPEALRNDARPRLAGAASPDARRHPGKTEPNSENEKQWP